jgi:predicted  nucleic acid-binding Zn-ribbon protein
VPESKIPGGSVDTETLAGLGTCLDCGGDEFNVTAMVKSFAGVHIGEAGNVNIDDTDFPGNMSSDMILEGADELLLSGHVQDLPKWVWEKMQVDETFNPSRYVVVRCNKCGKPFDYGDKQVVIGYD